MHALVAVMHQQVSSEKCHHVRLLQSPRWRRDTVSLPDIVAVVHPVIGCLDFNASLLSTLSCSAFKASLADSMCHHFIVCSFVRPRQHSLSILTGTVLYYLFKTVLCLFFVQVVSLHFLCKA